MKKVIIAAIILFPFQNLSIPLANSRYDLTCFLLLFAAIFYAIKNGRINYNAFYILLLFGEYQFLLYSIQQIAPFARFISGLVWLGGLLLLILISPKIIIQKIVVSKIILGLVLFSSIVIMLQKHLLNIERPEAFFDEASFAGLALYSASASTFLILLFIKTNLRFRILTILISAFIFYAALQTKSLHIVTFILTIGLFILIRMSSLHKRQRFKFIFLSLIFISILTIFSLNLFQEAHYSSRLDLSNIENNLSLLTWVRGYDQMVASIGKSSIFGLGLGATGHFKFDSIYNFALTSLGFGSLNLNDAYSLAFRLIIEIGLLSFIVFILFIIKRLLNFKKSIIYLTEMPLADSIPSIFLFIFSTSLIFGCLIKEPNYARSSIYLGIFLFSIPILDNSVIKNAVSKLTNNN